MLADMPLWKLGRDEEERLRQLAVDDHRSLREQAEYYLRLMVEQEYPKLAKRKHESVAEVS